MFLEHRYLATVQEGEVKIELYDTGRRTLLLKPIYAYQVFYNNRLMYENEHLVLSRGSNLIDVAISEAVSCIEYSEQLQIDYVPVQEVSC